MRTYKKQLGKFSPGFFLFQFSKDVKEMSSKTTEIEDSFVQIHSTACLHPYCNTVQTTFPLVPPHQQMLTHPLSEKNPHKIQQKKVV